MAIKICEIVLKLHCNQLIFTQLICCRVWSVVTGKTYEACCLSAYSFTLWLCILFSVHMTIWYQLLAKLLHLPICRLLCPVAAMVELVNCFFYYLAFCCWLRYYHFYSVQNCTCLQTSWEVLPFRWYIFAYQFMFKHVIDSTCCISENVGLKRCQYGKCNLPGHSRSLVHCVGICLGLGPSLGPSSSGLYL